MTANVSQQDRLTRRVDLELSPRSTRLGAEVHGIDLARPLNPAAVDAIRRALGEWKVLFFRGQHLGPRELVTFARHFGALAGQNTYDARHGTSVESNAAPEFSDAETQTWKEFPEIARLDHRRASEIKERFTALNSGEGSYNNFRGLHVDSSPLVNPPWLSILGAVRVPTYGGDTFWFDTTAAYEGLSDSVRRLADSLWAEHRLQLPPSLDGVPGKTWVAHHPVVRLIPQTGQRSLLLSANRTTRILDVTPEESEWLLAHLYREITRPGYSVRFKWDDSSLAISDNRTTAHLGHQDLSSEVDRVLHLLYVAGDIPISTDGRPSVLIEGDPKPESPRALELGAVVSSEVVSP